MATIELADIAISTSGDYERSFINDGKRYHHLLNPGTGYPAEGCQSVSIITKEGAFTDAFATGIFILGPEKGIKTLEKMGFDGVMVDSQGKVHTTPHIRGKVEFKRSSLILYGIRAALMVTLIRVVLASLFTGTFLGPAFILSLGGGVTSTLSMGIVLSLMPRLFGPVGLSLVGALFHNIAQLLLAYVLFIQRIEAILLITPVIIFLGTLTGCVNGIVSDMLIKNLKKADEKIQNS